MSCFVGNCEDGPAPPRGGEEVSLNRLLRVPPPCLLDGDAPDGLPGAAGPADPRPLSEADRRTWARLAIGSIVVFVRGVEVGIGEVRQNQTHHHMAMVRRIHAAEAQIRALGGTIEVSQSSFDAMAEARDWLLSATDELEDVTVTPSPPPGDPWKVGM